MSGGGHRPSFALTRHFFHGFLRVRFLTDAGADSFLRLILAGLGTLVTIGLWLPRLYLKKYALLFALPDPEPYRQAVGGDRLLMIALPMLLVGVVTSQIGHSLFPDEIDHRVLGPLAVERRRIFGAKLAALLLYAGLFGASAVVALAPLFAVTALGRWAETPWYWQAAAHVPAVVAGAVFALGGVLAVYGLVVVIAPRAWLQPLSVLIRTASLSLAVLSLPVVGRLPRASALIDDRSPVLLAVPPAWFLGIERTLAGSGDRYFSTLAALALGGLAIALVVGLGCYAILYRHFEQLVLRPPAGTHRSWGRATAPARPRHARGHPAHLAVRRFASATLRRSDLHQVIVAGGAACGAAWATNSLLGAGLIMWARQERAAPEPLVDAALSASFVVIFATVMAARAALRLPMTLEANWAFRLAEDEQARRHVVRAVGPTLVGLAVTPAVVAALPLQWWVLGAGALVAVPVGWLAGALLVEVIVADWRRVPFACSYVFGKRHIAQTVLVGLTTFMLFVGTGRGLLRASLAGFPSFLAVLALLGGGLVVLRRGLRATSGVAPLEFEDEGPVGLRELGLR